MISGIHHITAICGTPHQNYDFYTRILGLKLVKKTVNFDDPGTYHLYYGDETGSPGSLLTFFPYEGGSAPTRGAGQVTRTSYAVAPGSLKTWEQRLAQQPVPIQFEQRWGQEFLQFSDPHGMGLEIFESIQAENQELKSIGGLVLTLAEPDVEATVELLKQLGYQPTQQNPTTKSVWTRMQLPDSAQFIDLHGIGMTQTRSGGPGTVHHLALRVANDSSQLEWRKFLLEQGFHVSPVMDRNYFHSIYFRGPGGVLYELATDPPGMTVDESPETLGQSLRLPPQYEGYRKTLERSLAPLEAPYQKWEKPGHFPMLVGLHGTGGDENDLIPLLEQLDPKAAHLTLRGQVSENGARRFFRRLREGVFDQQDLARRSQELHQYLTLQVAGEKILVGYSNGANLAAHTMMYHPTTSSRAILLRPMLGWQPPQGVDLSHQHLLVLLGADDTMVSPESGRQLVKAFLELGAQVDVEEMPGGHSLTAADVRLAYRWLNSNPLKVC